MLRLQLHKTSESVPATRFSRSFKSWKLWGGPPGNGLVFLAHPTDVNTMWCSSNYSWAVYAAGCIIMLSCPLLSSRMTSVVCRRRRHVSKDHQHECQGLRLCSRTLPRALHCRAAISPDDGCKRKYDSLHLLSWSFMVQFWHSEAHYKALLMPDRGQHGSYAPTYTGSYMLWHLFFSIKLFPSLGTL